MLEWLVHWKRNILINAFTLFIAFFGKNLFLHNHTIISFCFHYNFRIINIILYNITNNHNSFYFVIFSSSHQTKTCILSSGNVHIHKWTKTTQLRSVRKKMSYTLLSISRQQSIGITRLIFKNLSVQQVMV